MSAKELLKTFQENKKLARQIAAVVEMPPNKAQYGKLTAPLPQELQSYLADQHVTLYKHQVEVVEKARRGENIVLVTPTASGKTLAFNLPVIEHLLQNKKDTALYIYPMKALAYDQLKELKNIENKSGTTLRPAVYDGDTPKSNRKKIREESRIIITNPHALHWYLPWHKLWAKFFRNLKFIIIDEAHWYRGIYGTNVAYLLRRLRRILQYYGADPSIIISSATMEDPKQHAFNLTNKNFSLVNKDCSARGGKTYLFWDAPKNPERSQHLQTADLVAACVNYQLQTLCFTVSRKMAELTALWASEQAGNPYIVPYRAGYLPEERRNLEKLFKNKELIGIASTNALELGVNIGGLDAVVIGGYPGTISSFHQRAGRAGRSGQQSMVIQVLYDNPLDGYILLNPSYLFQEPVEQAVISLDNSHIKKNHILCASEELPLIKEDEKWFGENYFQCVTELKTKGKIYPLAQALQEISSTSSTSYRYNGKNCCFYVSLTSFEEDTYKLMYNGRVLEELNKRQAYSEAHPGAIFLHKTEPYKVTAFNENNKEIVVEPFEGENYTTPLIHVEIKAEEIVNTKYVNNNSLNLGKVTVTEKVTGYTLRTYKKVLSWEYFSKPLTLNFQTMGVWVTFDSLKGLRNNSGGFHAAEHLLIAVAPLLAMCDRWDLGGVSSAGEGIIYIYDGFPHGIGISERLFQRYNELVSKALNVAESCKCEEGCPRCVISPKCGSNNQPLDKQDAVKLLKKIT